MKLPHDFRTVSRGYLTGRTFALIGALSAAAALATGCGSSSITGDAHIRAINMVPDGGAGIVYINGGSYTGDQLPGEISSYTDKPTGSTAFTFKLTTTLATANYATNTQSLAAGHYSAILFGKAGVTSTSAAGYPQLTVTSDDPTITPVAANALVRFIHAAPDSGSADAYIDATSVAPNQSFMAIGVFQSFLAQAVTFHYYAAGTKNDLAPPLALTLTPQHRYTVFLMQQPSNTTPAYQIKAVDESA